MKTLFAAMAIVLVASACHKKSESRSIETPTVSIGKSVDSQKKIATDDRLFKPNDTVYISIDTKEGEGEVKTVVKYGDKIAYSDSMKTANAEFVEFHFSKPSGLPEGNYTVSVSLFGQSKPDETFEVRK